MAVEPMLDIPTLKRMIFFNFAGAIVAMIGLITAAYLIYIDNPDPILIPFSFLFISQTLALESAQSEIRYYRRKYKETYGRTDQATR